jgi:hypothetical protein
MQDGMVSIMKRILLSVKEIVYGVSVQSIRQAYWSGAMLRFDLDRAQRILLAKGLSTIVRPFGARSPAIAGDALSRNAPVR